MDTEKTIPIIIGVTGHRAIREQDRPALAAAVKAELETLRGLCPHSPLVMLSSLAEGADLLCADAAGILWFICLWLLNLASGITGIVFEINFITTLIVGFLGIPGIILLLIGQFMK